MSKPEYYYRWWKDENGKRFHCIYERMVPGEDGICIYESVREVDARNYLTQLKR